MINRFWLIRNNCPKKHATYNRNINSYDRGVYLQVEMLFGRSVIYGPKIGKERYSKFRDGLKISKFELKIRKLII